jgi:hypothetical protein
MKAETMTFSPMAEQANSPRSQNQGAQATKNGSVYMCGRGKQAQRKSDREGFSYIPEDAR